MDRSFSGTKILFVLSFATLSLLYGFAACAKGWFPKRFLLTAWGQAEQTGIISYVGRQLPGFSPGTPDFLHPQVHDHTGAHLLEPEEVQPGLTLITSVGWKPGIKLIDQKGTVVHNWKVDMKELAGGVTDPEKGNVHGSHLLPNGDLIVNLEYAGTLRLDACGRILWEVPRGHHSVAKTDGGSFWVSSVSEEPQTRSAKYPDGFPGLKKPVYLDRLRLITADGEVLRTMNVLDLLYSNGLQQYIPRAYFEGSVDTDITHLNDVEPLTASMADEYPLFEGGDLVVSLRHLNLVFVVDPTTKEVKWHVSSPLIRQHDPDFIGEGWIGVFDNRTDFTTRGTMLGGSRIVAFQPHTDSTRVLFPTARSDTFYTPAGGKWQMLENGNMLLTETFAGRVVEVAPDGETVWEWVHEPNENAKVPEVTEGTRYDLTRKEVASWPCSAVDSLDV